jgi:hypothetical protein
MLDPGISTGWRGEAEGSSNNDTFDFDSSFFLSYSIHGGGKSLGEKTGRLSMSSRDNFYARLPLKSGLVVGSPVLCVQSKVGPGA